MGWFSGEDKADKLLDMGKTALDASIKGIGALIFTDQEKSNVSMELIKAHSEHVKSTLDEASTRSVTRRFVVYVIMSLYGIAFLACFGVAMVRLDLKSMIEIVGVFSLPVLALMVAGFFFGSHLVRGTVGAIKGQK